MKKPPVQPWIDSAPASNWSRVESGTYVYEQRPDLESEWLPAGVVERYRLYTNPDGTERCTRAQRDARATAVGVQLRVEAWERGGQYHTLVFELQDENEEPISRVRYEIDGQTLVVQRERPGEHAPSETLPVSAESVYLPLTRNFLGPVLAAIARRDGGQATVVTPDIRDPASPTVFAPLSDLRTARIMGAFQVMTTEARSWETELYHFVGGPYDEASSFWLCQETHTLIRYEFQMASGEAWSARLVGYDPS